MENAEEEGEDVDEDDVKEPWTNGQGEMVNITAHAGHIMVDDQTIIVYEQGQEMREDTPQPQPTVPAPWPNIV